MTNKHWRHLVFYDGNCGLCDQTVQFIFERDDEQLFAFAPLQGETASNYLKNLPPEIRFTDSLILIENYLSPHPKAYLLSQGAFRIAWLLGGSWLAIGWLSFLPGFLFDWAYRLVASNRHRFFPKGQCFIPPKDQKERFLS